MIEIVATQEDIVNIEVLDINHLICQTVTIDCKCIAVVCHCKNPCGDLRWMVVTTGAGASCCPVVTGEKAVLTLVGSAVDSKFRILSATIERIDETAVIRTQDVTFVLGRIHGEGNIKGLIGL